METQAQPHERAHPTPGKYIAIAVILTVVTAIEVTAYYTGLRQSSVFVPILLIFSATKFALVVMFFMHLRFDARLFSTFFVGGLLLGAAVLIALMSLVRAL
jgi:cytochrome c oxidase subunit 4